MSNYPAIPEPQLTLESARESILALKELVENIVGTRGPQSTTLASQDKLTAALTSIEELDTYTTELEAALAAEVIARDAAIAAALEIADDRILANISGSTAGASATELTALLDAIIGTARGSLLVRGETAWGALAPGAAGRFLQSQGAGADLTYGEVAPPVWTTAFKAADQSRTSSTAWTDVTDLAFDVVSGETYHFHFYLPYVAGAAELHIALNGPSFTRLHTAINVSAYDTLVQNLGANRTAGYANMQGFITVSANGTLTLRMRQGTSSVDAVTIYAGAMVRWAQVS